MPPCLNDGPKIKNAAIPIHCPTTFPSWGRAVSKLVVSGAPYRRLPAMSGLGSSAHSAAGHNPSLKRSANGMPPGPAQRSGSIIVYASGLLASCRRRPLSSNVMPAELLNSPRPYGSPQGARLVQLGFALQRLSSRAIYLVLQVAPRP